MIYNTSNGSIYSNGSNVPYGMNDIAKERPEYYVAQRGERGDAQFNSHKWNLLQELV